MVDEYDDGRSADDKDDLKPLNIKKKPKRQTAVALSQEGDKNKTPSVKAAGRGAMAEKILQLAFENDVKVREDRALAEMLAKIEIDSPIPTETFLAVGEILSYVYRANNSGQPFNFVFKSEEDDQKKDDTQD